MTRTKGARLPEPPAGFNPHYYCLMGRFGPGEIVIIAVFALLIFGPRRLPEMARSAGKALREFKRATAEVTDELRSMGDISNGGDITQSPPSLPESSNLPGPKRASDSLPPSPGG